MEKITVLDALQRIHIALNNLTVTGAYNAKILSAVYDDLGTVIEALKEGEKNGNTTESSYRDV